VKNETTELERIETGTLPARALSEKSVGALPLDVKKYQSHLEDFDMTEEQKLELLETLWSIMAAFVDLGFGIDAVQYIFRDNGPNSLDSGGDEAEEMKHSSRFNHIALITRGKEDCS
jgi:hypothetical protein